MFSPVILILVSIWTSTYGAMVCDTLSGVACDFPFKRTPDGPEFKTCQRGAEGRTWCATSKIAATGVYDTWGYCNPTSCKEVPSVDEAREKVQKHETCFQCIEAAAIGPPPNAKSLLCLPPCVFVRNNFLCHFTLLKTGTRECLEPCGFKPVFDKLSFATHLQPACVKRNIELTEGTTLATVTLFAPSLCGEHCAKNFKTQCTGWNWFSGSIVGPNKFQCVCLEGSVTPKTSVGVFSGTGPASAQGPCPPK